MKHIGVGVLFCVALSSPASGQESTWQTIRQRIFDVRCVQCHVEGTSFAIQSGLVLAGDQVYDNLIDVQPRNSAAASAGLVRVSSVGGLASPHLSFLWEKINAPNQAHFYADHPNYGSLMPLGLPSLTNGEIAFMTAWIEAGAPESGVAVDPSLLDDDTRYEPPAFEPLVPPEHGMQFHLGPYDVWPAELNDREFLYFEPYKTQQDVYVSGYEIAMRPGSHHFIIYNYPTGDSTPSALTYRDIRNADGVYNLGPLLQINYLFPYRFFVGTQTPYVRYQFPEGIALRLPPGSGFDLNSHSVNRSGVGQTGEVYANIYTVDASEVEHVAVPGNFSNEDLYLPPNQVTTVERTFTFLEQRHLLQIWAHAHEHMTEFRIEGVGGAHGGELLYWTNDWQHPPLLHLDPPITFEAGDRVKLATTYHNQTDHPIQFGLLSSDEMQFMFYMYFAGGRSTATEDPGKLPDVLSLAPNFPNPFQESTTLSFRLPHPEYVQLQVFDVLGQEVAVLVDEVRPAGVHEVVWQGGSLPSGVYLMRIRAGLQVRTRIALLIR